MLPSIETILEIKRLWYFAIAVYHEDKLFLQSGIVGVILILLVLYIYICMCIVYVYIYSLKSKIILICLRIYGTKPIKNNNTNSKIFSGIASLGGIRGMVLSCISFCLQCEISRYTTWHINHFCMSDKFQ